MYNFLYDACKIPTTNRSIVDQRGLSELYPCWRQANKHLTF